MAGDSYQDAICQSLASFDVEETDRNQKTVFIEITDNQ